MKPYSRLAVALIIVASVCFAQAPASSAIETAGLSNGRRWSRMEINDRLIYIIAYHDGLMAGVFYLGSGTQKEKIARLAEMYPATMTLTEIGVAIDTFYNTPENALISVPRAMSFIAMKAAGVQQAEIDRLLSLARKVAADSFAPK